MIRKVVLPKSGMGIEEGTITRWLKNVGDHVQKGEVIVEIETAKAAQEVEAPVTGRMQSILVSAGETVTVNAEIAAIDESGG